MSRKNLPNPATCSEAASSLREEANGANVTPDTRSHYRDLAFVLAAFGDAPVPAPILDRWEWSRIG